MKWQPALIAFLFVACTGQAGAHPSVSRSSPNPAALAVGGIVEYQLPPPPRLCAYCAQSVQTMTLGPDGNVWFVDGNSQVVGRVSPAGSVSYFAMPVQLAGGAQTIAAGPDHNLWVLGRGDNASQHDWVLRVSVDGVVTKFPTPGIDVSPESITAGPDGNLWFTEFSISKVARITPAGDVAEYSIVNQDAHPRGITTGHDGNLWFAEDDRSRPTIGRISPQGVETEFHLDQIPTNATPDDIVAGADGNLWITRWTGEGFGHMSPTGEYVAVALPQGSRAEKAIAGPDGSIWFTDPGKNAIGRVSVAGVIREFPVPRINSYLDGLAIGADGRIWFGEGTRIASIGIKVPEAAFSERVAIYPGLTSQTVTVTNTGEAALAITGVTLTGVDRNAFVIGPDTCRREIGEFRGDVRHNGESHRQWTGRCRAIGPPRGLRQRDRLAAKGLAGRAAPRLQTAGCRLISQ